MKRRRRWERGNSFFRRLRLTEFGGKMDVNIDGRREEEAKIRMGLMGSGGMNTILPRPFP